MATSAAPTLFRDGTRATPFQTKLTLPPNFAGLLKDYTREVLREQPTDLLEWSAEYFKRRALETDPLQPQQPPPGHYAPAVPNPALERVVQAVVKVLRAADAAGTGRLYLHVVKRALLEDFGLDRAQALYVLSTDASYTSGADGTLDYDHFARTAASAIQYFQQDGRAFAVAPATDAVHGLQQAELGDAVLRVLREADPVQGELGRLPYATFRGALLRAPLQLTERDVNLLCAEAELSADGYVDIRREAGQAFSLLALAREFTHFDDEME
jgi:hypothetical protein